MKKSITERFWSKVEILGEDDCWEWQGAINTGGYGNFRMDGKVKQAHRIAFLLYYHFLPDDKDICHSCDNTKCCNPKHLWTGTDSDNMIDMWGKGRRLKSFGSSNWYARLNESLVLEIRKLFSQGMKQSEICRRYNLHKATVSKVVNRHSWNHI